MKVRTYLVLGQHQRTGEVSVRRAVSRRTSLLSHEAVIALELDIPDDAFEAPLFTVEIAKRQIQVAIEPEDVGD